MKLEKFKKLKKFALVRSGDIIERIQSFEYDDNGEIYAVNLLDADKLTVDDLEENIFEVGDTIFTDRGTAKVVAIDEDIIINDKPTYTYETSSGQKYTCSYILGETGHLSFRTPKQCKFKGSSFERTDIVQNVCEVLDDAEYPYNKEVVVSICEEWWRNKKDLIDLLRKHPGWDEKSMCIKGEVSEIRGQDDNLFLKACKELYHNCRENGMYLSDEQLDIMWDGVQCTLPSKFVTKTIYDRFLTLGIDMKIGAKYSRELNKIFVNMGLDKYPNYNHDFAAISDAINPIANKQTAILSVNPCDFLKMSYGEKWSSCHNIKERGCYHAGTQSYIMDGSSMIFYTISNSYSGEPWENPKLTRQIYCYEDGAFLQSRNYPNHSCPARDQEYTRFVSEVLSTCLGIENKFHAVDNDRHICTNPDSLHYPDYAYSEYNTQTYVFDNIKHEKKGIIHVGAPSLCLKCGEIIDDHESMICGDCDDSYNSSLHQNAFLQCHQCGFLFFCPDPYSYPGYNNEDGNVYCVRHYRTCDYCHESFFGNNVTHEVRCMEDGRNICSDCLEEMGLVLCDRCGKLHKKSECIEYTMNNDTKKYLCNQCHQCPGQGVVDICPECGDLYINFAESELRHRYCASCRNEMSCGDTVRVNYLDEVYVNCGDWLKEFFPQYKLLSGEKIAEYDSRDVFITGTLVCTGRYYSNFNNYISVIDVGNGFAAVVADAYIERI